MPDLCLQSGRQHQLTLSWPADATSFTLESTVKLPAVNWTPVGVVNNQVTINISEGSWFYRLRK
jgi:hypothetical protein